MQHTLIKPCGRTLNCGTAPIRSVLASVRLPPHNVHQPLTSCYTLYSYICKSIGHHPTYKTSPKTIIHVRTQEPTDQTLWHHHEYIIKLTWSNCESLITSSCAYTTNLSLTAGFHTVAYVCNKDSAIRCAGSGRWQ